MDEAAIEILYEPARTVLMLSGVVDTQSAQALHDAAREAASAGKDVVADCGGVLRLDGSVIQTLLALRRELAARALRFEAAGCEPATVACFRLAGVQDLLLTQVSGE